MEIKRKNKSIYMLLVLMIIIINLGPILWAFTISITPEFEMFASTLNFFPTEPTFDNYRTLFDLENRQSLLFFEGLMNSLKACIVTLIFGIPCTILAAYALSRFHFRFKKVIRNLLIFTMVIPVFATIIPLYSFYARFNLLDNIFWLSIVYVSAFLPVATWMLMNQFNSIPVEIEDAASIDGCSKLKILTKIYIPISKPTILAIILIIFLQTWNQFQIPLILASSRATKPMAIVISEFMTKESIMYGLTAAGGMIAILPPILIAIVFRKLLIGDLANVGMK